LVGVGTELLLGQIANTNAQYISQELADAGVDVYFHVVVGDNLERVASTIATALDRSEVVVVTGGLGPTPDDLTREGVAAALGVALRRDDHLVGVIKRIFEGLGRVMPAENLKQADLPEGATPLEPEGTAPGLVLERDGKLLFALPGVPWEMKAMLGKFVLPALRDRAGESTLVTRQVLVMGLGESMTHEKIADIVAEQTNPTVAFLAGRGQVRVRITAKAETEREALELIHPVEQRIRERLGEAAVPGGRTTIAQALGDALRERGASAAVAESLTGGLIGAALTETDGASDFFLGSLVTYATAAKRDVAGIDEDVLDRNGPVSERAAGALAEAAAAHFGADMGLSATGVAGPTEQDGMPVGTVFVGAAYGGRTEVRHVRAYGDRDHIRQFAVTSTLDLGRRLLHRGP
jgi:nicotinamide-nucleotide amidase